MDEDLLFDEYGSLSEERDSGGLVLLWTATGETAGSVVLRHDTVANMLCIYPKRPQSTSLVDQFEQLTEIRIDVACLRGWDPQNHSREGATRPYLRVNGLPKGFREVYCFGLGIKRDYRGFFHEVEAHSLCTVVHFTHSSADEGADGDIYRIALRRFEEHRAAVDLTRSRAETVFRRVKASLEHNALAELRGVATTNPIYGRKPVIQLMTRAVTDESTLSKQERSDLIDALTVQAPAAAKDQPAQFGKLRHDIDLVSLEVLISQFEAGLQTAVGKKEAHWQGFFKTNPFALQQIFSAPVALYGDQLLVKGPDAHGGGTRIADFVCVNTVTRSALVVEIKTPQMSLMQPRPYRGGGTAAIYPPHADLTAALSQVQAQMESASRHFPALLRETLDLDSIDPFDVRGAVVAGTVSELGQQQRTSFQRYRSGLNAVTVLGYDEVCERLKGLLAMLQAPPDVDIKSDDQGVDA